MSEAKSGDKVKVHYTGTLEDGTQFDSSVKRDPLEFTLGEQQVIDGFDKAVTGMKAGDKKEVKLPPEEAYGPRYEELVLQVPKEQVPADVDPKIGDQLELKHPSGQALVVTVTTVEDDHIILDGNHPLAGQTLNFALELVEIS